MAHKKRPVVPEARSALNALKEQIQGELLQTHHPNGQRFRELAERHTETFGVTTRRQSDH